MSDPFELLPEDIEYLDANHQGRWQKLNEGGGKFGLLILQFSVPEDFVQPTSDLLILIPAGYPASPLDMFYFDPPLRNADGRDAGALATEEHFGRHWQRWSRHYQWVPGQDDLTRHVEYVWHELQTAVSK